MGYRIEAKPLQEKEGQKYKIIQITDIALHTTSKPPTQSVGRKIQKAFEHNKPDRIYSTKTDGIFSDSKAFVIDLLKNDADFVKMLQEEESKGYKVLIEFPQGGIPVLGGKDTVEFIDSKNGQRFFRGLAKEISTE